jgi:hypothetical protein
VRVIGDRAGERVTCVVIGLRCEMDKTILSKYLSPEQLSAFAAEFTVETFVDKALIFGQGDSQVDAFYIVADGTGPTPRPPTAAINAAAADVTADVPASCVVCVVSCSAFGGYAQPESGL